MLYDSAGCILLLAIRHGPDMLGWHCHAAHGPKLKTHMVRKAPSPSQLWRKPVCIEAKAVLLARHSTP